ncbi:hypothetical protein [Dongshaea marina]|uniref:hypothetical protein n=1 Tax=Dongshaea marina TaxID=2047966 RepID=UPI000D3EC0C0|nr:hypothetical protein [Dongshaea marina]
MQVKKLVGLLGLVGAMTVTPFYATASGAAALMPVNNHATKPQDVMYYQNATSKTITLMNHSNKVIYPVLVGANSNSKYDRHDPENQAYRAYVGYQENGRNYLGLKPGTVVKIPVPQAFWDSGRMELLDANPVSSKDSNTFTYKVDATRFAQPISKTASMTLKSGETLQGSDGVLMLYHSPVPQAMGLDAPSQLIEFTYRDPSLAGPGAPASETHNLINYDVSYVDHMYLPVAMEAQSPSGSAQVGYIGTGISVDKMQNAIKEFADNSGDILGITLMAMAGQNFTCRQV